MFDRNVRHTEFPNGFPEKRALPRFGFHHHQPERRPRQPKRNRRRASAGPKIKQEPIRRQEVIGSGERLDDQPVQRLISRRIDGETGQIDTAIPPREKREVRGERHSQIRRKRDASPRGTPIDPGREVGFGHDLTFFAIPGRPASGRFRAIDLRAQRQSPLPPA